MMSILLLLSMSGEACRLVVMILTRREHWDAVLVSRIGLVMSVEARNLGSVRHIHVCSFLLFPSGRSGYITKPGPESI